MACRLLHDKDRFRLSLRPFDGSKELRAALAFAGGVKTDRPITAVLVFRVSAVRELNLGSCFTTAQLRTVRCRWSEDQ